MSHGESTLQIIGKYLGPPGFCYLDEPETALSSASTLALVAAVQELSSTPGSQLLCATRSPLITALLGATIPGSATGASARRRGTTSSSWRAGAPTSRTPAATCVAASIRSCPPHE